MQEFKKYTGESKIALMDNSTVAFLEKIEKSEISTKKLLADYDAILLPKWVLKEVNDSIYRKRYIEELIRDGLPIYTISEEKYSKFVYMEEGNLYQIVLATVSMLGPLKSYLRRYVEEPDPLDMEEYHEWILKMYKNWPLSNKDECIKRKNAGEISLVILAEIFSWYYPAIELITIYTQDYDCFAYQKNAHKILKNIFKNKSAVEIGFKSNDFLLSLMYRKKVISVSKIKELRKNERYVTYTRKQKDESTILISSRLDNEKFIELLNDKSAQVIF